MDNQKKSFTIKARIIISGFECSPDSITSIIGIKPAKVWRRGEKVHPKAQNEHKVNGWLIYSPRDETNCSVDNQIQALYKLISPLIGRFQNLPEGSITELSCIVYAYEYMPSISFSSDVVSFLSTIKASIDVDVYDLTETEGD